MVDHKINTYTNYLIFLNQCPQYNPCPYSYCRPNQFCIMIAPAFTTSSLIARNITSYSCGQLDNLYNNDPQSSTLGAS